jgi:hypothetical protein
MQFAKAVLPTLALLGVIVLAIPYPLDATQASTATENSDSGVETTIEGLVRDIACPMQNHQSTATHFNLKCAEACARAGSPLIILTRTDEIYFPMTDQMPDRNMRDELVPYVGRFVRVAGTVYRRNGTRTIVIKRISVLPNVKLDPNLGDD